ncbi:hypothetical protein SteCoe_25291 [Stentor coeruleus]|uniref:Uncharacterized protein n=1 Tax=Stentor coeruleus TaxID=5963 RepID=A0A1R2BFK7_9CILI|nr:hypothetical protein SteCoe_25291 [Stentor coeruleus]
MNSLNIKGKEEQEILAKLDGPDNTYYFLHQPWMIKWAQFIKYNKERPGKIINKELFSGNGRLKPGLERGIHYRCINSKQWEFLKSNYSCDMEICQKTTDIYGNLIEDKHNNIETIVKPKENSLKTQTMTNDEPKRYDPKTKSNDNSISNKEYVVKTKEHVKSLDKTPEEGKLKRIVSSDRRSQFRTEDKNLIKLSYSPKPTGNQDPKNDVKTSYLYTNDKTTDKRLETANSQLLSANKKYSDILSKPPLKTISEFNSIKKTTEGYFPFESPNKSPINSQNSTSSRLVQMPKTLSSSMFLFQFGIENPMYQCFMNSALQCLFSFPQAISDIAQTKSSSPVLSAIKNIVKDAQNGRKSVSAAPLASFFARQFPKNKQHDSPEFLRLLLDKLNTEFGIQKALPKSSDPWEIHKSKFSEFLSCTFLGLLCSTVECLKCSNKTYSYEPFTTLILKLTSSLTDSISDFMSKEKILREYKCAKCKALRDIHKSFSLHTLPPYLILQLKRFKWTPHLTKVSSFCNFEPTLSIKNLNGQSVNYRLISIIVHSGTAEGGHYYTYSYRGDWYCFNDNEVRPCSQREVFDSQAYVLCYSQT